MSGTPASSSPILASRAAKRLRRFPRLSEPLLEVLQLMAEGKGCMAMAEALGKDKSAISREMKQAVRKLGADSQQEALHKAREIGLIP